MTNLERYSRAVVRHPVAVLVAVFAATGAIALGVLRLRTNFDIEASLPTSHPFIALDREIREQFGGRNAVLVAIVPQQGDVWQPHVLRVVHEITLAALRLRDVISTNVVSLTAPSVRVVEESGDALDVRYLMREVPDTAEGIAAVRAKVERDPQLRDMLVSPDQAATFLVVDFWQGASNQAIAREVMELASPHRSEALRFYFAGEPINALFDVEQSKEVASRIMPMMLTVMALLLVVTFRNFQGMFIPMLTAILSSVCGLGIMGWFGVPIDMWNAAVPMFVVAIAAAHSAQMLKRYTEEVAVCGDSRVAVVASMTSVGPVMMAAGGVAALGFASLAVSRVPSITNFGLASAFGISSAVALEMTLIPALRALLPAPRRLPATGGPTRRLLTALESAITKNGGRVVIWGTVAALVLAAVGIASIRTYGSSREYMAKGSFPRANLEQIERYFQGTVTFTVLYKGPQFGMNQMAVLKHIDALQREMEKSPLVWRTSSLVDLVKAIHQTFNSQSPDPYRIPDDQQMLSQLMFFGESTAFERFTDRAHSRGLVIGYLRDDDPAKVGLLVRHLREWLEGNPPPDGFEVKLAGGTGAVVLAVNEDTIHGKMVSLLIVLAAIFLISSWIFRSWLGGVYVCTPIVLSIVMLFGLLGWSGIRFDVGSASVIALAAGVGADYAIYVLYRFQEENARSQDDAEAIHRTLQTSGRAVVFVAVSIGSGFAVMASSTFLGLRLAGILIPWAMLVSCAAALSVLPVMVLRSRPAFLYRRRSEETEPLAPCTVQSSGAR